MTRLQGYRSAILHFPRPTATPSADYRYYPDGLLVVEGDRIAALGDWQHLSPRYPGLKVYHHEDALLLPGLIDAHLHASQLEMIGCYGEQLLDWLDRYTFPAERRYSDPSYASQMADHLLQELFRNGTTTIAAFCTAHPHSVTALFEAASAHNMRLIAGKVLMDRHGPGDLCDTAESGYRQSQALIERWHGQGRNLYAITPRFAPSCSPAQLAAAGKLARAYPEVYIQSHLAENPREVAWVRELFPDHPDYLSVYEQAGLVRERAIYAHGIYLGSDAFRRLASSGAAIAFCPSSNLFLGSGLFDLQGAREAGVAVALGSDVGAGTSLNMLQTQADAYRVGQLRGHVLHPLEGLYLSTLGSAVALGLEQEIGNLAPGSCADFILLDPAATPLLALRTKSCRQVADTLFAMSVLGDDRLIRETVVAGRCVYRRNPINPTH